MLHPATSQPLSLQEHQTVVVDCRFLEDAEGHVNPARSSQSLQALDQLDQLQGLALIRLNLSQRSEVVEDEHLPINPEDRRSVSLLGRPDSLEWYHPSPIRGSASASPGGIARISGLRTEPLLLQTAEEPHSEVQSCPRFEPRILSFCVDREQDCLHFELPILPSSGRPSDRTDIVIESATQPSQSVVLGNGRVARGWPFRIVYTAWDSVSGEASEVDEQPDGTLGQCREDLDGDSDTSGTDASISGGRLSSESGSTTNDDSWLASAASGTHPESEERQEDLDHSSCNARSMTSHVSPQRSRNPTILAVDSSSCTGRRSSSGTLLKTCSTCSTEPPEREKPLETVRISDALEGRWRMARVLYDSGSPFNLIMKGVVYANPGLKRAFKRSIPKGMSRSINIGSWKLRIIGHLELVLERKSTRFRLRKCFVLERDDPFKSSNLLVGWKDARKILGLWGTYQGGGWNLEVL